MIRKIDWAQQLADYLSDRSTMPFQWGTNDCATFATGAIKAMTDIDHTADFPKYDSALSAMRIVEEHGGLDKLVSKYYSEVPVLMAQRGDIVQLQTGLGVVVGSVVWAPGEKGVEYCPLHEALKAWRI